jgi:hypothetical protein
LIPSDCLQTASRPSIRPIPIDLHPLYPFPRPPSIQFRPQSAHTSHGDHRVNRYSIIPSLCALCSLCEPQLFISCPSLLNILLLFPKSSPLYPKSCSLNRVNRVDSFRFSCLVPHASCLSVTATWRLCVRNFFCPLPADFWLIPLNDYSYRKQRQKAQIADLYSPHLSQIPDVDPMKSKSSHCPARSEQSFVTDDKKRT